MGDNAEEGDGRAKKRRKTAKDKEKEKEEQAIIGEAVQYHCNYCRKDISYGVRTRCAICNDFDLCIECFSVGVELTEHKNDHDYKIIDAMHFPFLSEDWGADEEILLLEGMEVCGAGNWEDIAEHVTTKTKEECEEHYHKYYINAAEWPLPDLTKIMSTREDVKRLNSGKLTREDGASISVTNGRKPRPRKPINNRTAPSVPVDPDLAGFMPKRGEFETEYDNDAEFLIKDMVFEEDDTPEEKDAKVQLLQLYNWRLDRRAQRRQFVLDHGLHDLKKIQALEKKRTKEEKELYNKTKKYLQLTTNDDYDEFVKGLFIEKQLKERIQQLQEYRRMGVRTLAESEVYEKEKKARETAKRQNYPKPTVGRKPIKRQMDPASTVLDITGKPAVDLLSDKERDLCSSLRLYPEQYLVIKETMIREFLKSNFLNKANIVKIIKIDPAKVGRIFDFFEESAWINRKPQQPQPGQPGQPGQPSQPGQPGQPGQSGQPQIRRPSAPQQMPNGAPMPMSGVHYGGGPNS